MLPNISTPLNRQKEDQRREQSRENHMKVNIVSGKEEEDNSPKEKESEKKGKPHEEVEEIPFQDGKADKTFRIGTKEYEDVFAWGPEDIPEIDPAVVVHKLYVDPSFQPIKQKKRLFNDEKEQSDQGRGTSVVKGWGNSRIEFSKLDC
ncbi:hypothetical protein LIER_32775 [Lithospermum erythrorhizon]|uniref:Uncharacterized protein n=1 Tax=Lithospermum erythrorhizon TaxID=34254 RepID=A0AAV3RYP0_LITER